MPTSAPSDRAVLARERKAAFDALLSIGGQMSNVMYNMGQHSTTTLRPSDKECMADLAKQWDAARARWRAVNGK